VHISDKEIGGGMCKGKCKNCGEEKDCPKCCDEHMKEHDGMMHCDKCGHDMEKMRCDKCGGEVECKKEEDGSPSSAVQQNRDEKDDDKDEKLEEMPDVLDEEM
jgi:hypothetical protein